MQRSPASHAQIVRSRSIASYVPESCLVARANLEPFQESLHEFRGSGCNGSNGRLTKKMTTIAAVHGLGKSDIISIGVASAGD